jgi:hypothetical protein
MNVSPFEEDDNCEVSVKVWWKFERFDKFVVRRVRIFNLQVYLFCMLNLSCVMNC